MGLLLIFLLAIGLCFDSFAVSLGTGTICERFCWRSVRFAVILGIMQAIMPFIGWLAIGEFHSHVAAIDHWIAFVLLAFLGGKMIVSGIRAKEEKQDCNPLSLGKALLMGIATSIDALIAGVALALVKIDIVDGSQLLNITIAVAVIFVVTFIASAIGLIIGRGVGKKLGTRAEIIGGVILVLIGCKVLVEHLSHDDCAPAAQAKVICFNIRYENAVDGDHIWSNRRQAILRMIDTESPEFLGIQEGLEPQVEFLDSMLVNYTYVGVGRDDGITQGEYAAIFYDSTRVIKLTDGFFWLCPTPDQPALGWDAVCVRIASWGQFALKSNPTESFFVVNTHFDHIGTEARARSGELIIHTVDSIGGDSPMILMGDFNCTVADKSLAPILSKMNDSRPDTTTAVRHTYIGFGELSNEASIIDHIFTRGITTTNYRVITNHFDAPYGQLSDHLPVAVNFTIQPK